MKAYNRKLLVFLSSCLLLAAGVAVAVMARRLAQGEQLPEVISKVKSLEVIGVIVRREGEATAALAIEIRNTSDKSVIAFSVESGDDKNASGININGDISDDQPTAVIEPHGIRTVELPVGDIHPGKPVKVGGAIYADGTEDGDEATLRSMHEHQKRDKATSLKWKGGSTRQ
jgi:hypothetical protein